MGTLFASEPRTPGAAHGCSEDDAELRRLVLCLADVRPPTHQYGQADYMTANFVGSCKIVVC